VKGTFAMKKFVVFFCVLFVFVSASPSFAADGPIELLWRLIGSEKFGTTEPMVFDDLNETELDADAKSPVSDDLNGGSIAVLSIMLLCTIPVFIIGMLFSKKTRCIIVFGWGDFVLTLVPIATFIAADCVLAETQSTFLVLNILFCVSAFVSFAVSILSNLKFSGTPRGVIYAVISVITKLSVMLMAPLLLFLLFGMFFAGEPAKRDRRFKTGWRPRRDSPLFFMILALATFMLYGVMKNPSDMISDDLSDE
jgi:hypothetical protein